MKEDKESNAPLSLCEIRQRISQETFHWLQDAERKKNSDLEAAAEVQGNVSGGASLFDQFDNDSEDEYEFYRVQEWCSSSFKPDGIGGYANCTAEEYEQVEDDALRIKYVLSDAGGGHGDDLWAASRHISNIFANAEKCRDILSSDTVISDTSAPDTHPLLGLKFVELGAGAGVPSWTAMQCGARVVCTDQSIPDRIRCMAECAERNLRIMRKHHDEDDHILLHAELASACPYDWGRPIDEVVEALHYDESEGDNRLFDIVVAADCIYMPHFHSLLLDSIKLLMSRNGLALLPFALHGNTKDDNVWGIVDLAKEKGFNVTVLESVQLTPQSEGMDSKRAFIHTIKLKWK